MVAATLVDIRATPRRPHLTLDLSEFQFDPRYGAEYLQRHLKPGTDLIDLLDDANEGRERTCHHTDQVILLEHHEIGHGHLHHQPVFYHGIGPNASRADRSQLEPATAERFARGTATQARKETALSDSPGAWRGICRGNWRARLFGVHHAERRRQLAGLVARKAELGDRLIA